LSIQQGDVLLFQTNDDGEIIISSGVATMSGGLETAAYLSLFGGNRDDRAGSDETMTWWGNLDETTPSREYRSATQNLLALLPLTTSNLRRIEGAARADLAWMTADKVASTVSVAASIPGLNKIKLSVAIEAVGEETLFEFTENWKAEA
jgi:phage gp46-like protein